MEKLCPVLFGNRFGRWNGGHLKFDFLEGKKHIQYLAPLELMGGFQVFSPKEDLAVIAKPFGGHARFGNTDEFEVKVDSQSASPSKDNLNHQDTKSTKKSENQRWI